MAAGLPIVTTDVAAQPEAVTHGENGFVVPSGDVRALGSAVQRLVDDPALRAALGRRSRAIAEERFDARRNAARVADVVLAGIENWKGRLRRS
jgi:glycosyltransferase involved in cell wall biosynthesis